MSIYSLADCKKYLAEALATRSKILKSQEYTIDKRNQRRVELEQLSQDIKKWEQELKFIYASNPELNPNTTTQKTRRGPTVSTVGYRR